MCGPQRNVEVVRRSIELVRRGADSEQLLDFWDPRCDYYPVEKFPESRPCRLTAAGALRALGLGGRTLEAVGLRD